MCSDACSAPPAPESTDLVAMIHPSSDIRSRYRGRLRLSNRGAGATRSELQFQSVPRSQSVTVRIHKFGQPVDSEIENAVPINPIMHSFFLDESSASTLATRLDLGVGGEGIVGRAVSILDDRRILVGQGIIGWSRQD